MKEPKKNFENLWNLLFKLRTDLDKLEIKFKQGIPPEEMLALMQEYESEFIAAREQYGDLFDQIDLNELSQISPGDPKFHAFFEKYLSDLGQVGLTIDDILSLPLSIRPLLVTLDQTKNNKAAYQYAGIQDADMDAEVEGLPLIREMLKRPIIYIGRSSFNNEVTIDEEFIRIKSSSEEVPLFMLDGFIRLEKFLKQLKHQNYSFFTEKFTQVLHVKFKEKDKKLLELPANKGKAEEEFFNLVTSVTVKLNEQIDGYDCYILLNLTSDYYTYDKVDDQIKVRKANSPPAGTDEVFSLTGLNCVSYHFMKARPDGFIEIKSLDEFVYTKNLIVPTHIELMSQENQTKISLLYAKSVLENAARELDSHAKKQFQTFAKAHHDELMGYRSKPVIESVEQFFLPSNKYS